MMQPRLEARLAELRREYETGQRMLADLDRQRTELQHTLLRIAGAIQVLEELLAPDATGAPLSAPDAPPADDPPDAKDS